MSYLCYATHALNKHLAQEEKDESYSEAVESIVNELMADGAKYDPLSAANMSEALPNLGPYDFAAVDEIFRRHWAMMAEKEAIRQLAKDAADRAAS